MQHLTPTFSVFHWFVEAVRKFQYVVCILHCHITEAYEQTIMGFEPLGQCCGQVLHARFAIKFWGSRAKTIEHLQRTCVQ